MKNHKGASTISLIVIILAIIIIVGVFVYQFYLAGIEQAIAPIEPSAGQNYK
ncbi:MAG: hypothetical protein Q7J54_04505 [Candidatus Woesearchaeota archaeon]|nr:hypothetical protein [Candidatus Woesearchaeota archaeon]